MSEYFLSYTSAPKSELEDVTLTSGVFQLKHPILSSKSPTIKGALCSGITSNHVAAVYHKKVHESS